MNAGGIQAPTVGIARLVGEGSRFVVFDHQRDYPWTEDEIEQLLEDTSNAQRTGRAEYSLGLMVLLDRQTREYGILDGQQRLATTTITLASIAKWPRARGLDDDAHQVQSPGGHPKSPTCGHPKLLHLVSSDSGLS